MSNLIHKSKRKPSNPTENGLIIAAKFGRLDDVKYYVEEMKVNINLEDNMRFTAIHLACRYGKRDVAKYLIEKGAIVDFPDGSRSPIHLAVEQGKTSVVELLIKKKVNIECRTNAKFGFTPLHLACDKNKLPEAKLLIEGGADIEAKSTGRGFTPAHVACQNGHVEILEYLISKGCKVNALTTWKFSCLHLASMEGFDDVIEVLIKHGAKTDVRNDEGKTPLDVVKNNDTLERFKNAIKKYPTAVQPDVNKPPHVKSDDNKNITRDTSRETNNDNRDTNHDINRDINHDSFKFGNETLDQAFDLVKGAFKHVNKSYDSQISELENKHKDEIKKISDEYDNKIKKINEENDSKYKNATVKLYGEISSNKSKIDDLTKKNEQLTNDCVSMNNESNILKERYQILLNNFYKIDSKNEESKNENSKLRTENTKLKEWIEELRNENNRLVRELKNGIHTTNHMTLDTKLHVFKDEKLKDFKIHGRVSRSINNINYGRNSIVYKAEFEGKFYALKLVFTANEEMNDDILDRHKSEYRHIPDHKNILKIFHHFIDTVDRTKLEITDEINIDKTLFTISEIYDTNLKHLTSKRFKTNKQRFSVSEFVKVAEQIINAVIHLRKHKIIHRDIKPDNIFINENTLELAIGDFGSLLNFAESMPDNTDFKIPYQFEFIKGGLISYLAPEIALARPGKNSFLDYSKSDIYSVGLTLYLMFTGMIEVPLVKLMKNGKLDSIDGFPEINDLITKMTAKDPVIRITEDEALSLLKQIKY